MKERHNFGSVVGGLAIFVQFLHSNEIQQISPRKFEIWTFKFPYQNFKFPGGNLLNFIYNRM